MASIGVNIKIDVSKIDKSKMFKGQKGTYLDATVFIDLDQQDKHGNNGMIVQDWKDAPKGQTPILGNVKVFWSDQQQGQTQQGSRQGSQNPKRNPTSNTAQSLPDDSFDDDCPFAPIAKQYRSLINCM